MIPLSRICLRCLSAWLLLSAVSASAAERLNVLLIIIDDLKPQLGCYGAEHVHSPNIDALARRGVKFTSAYCNQAHCSASRNSMLTSLRPQTLGIYDQRTNFRVAIPTGVTLGTHFRQKGYRTEALGKIFHASTGNHEDVASWSVPHWNPRVGLYRLPESTAVVRIHNGKKRYAATECAEVSDNAYADGKIAAEARQRLEIAASEPDVPFFMAVGFHKPHLPFAAPKKYWDLYDPAELPLPRLPRPPEGAPEYAPTNSPEIHGYSDMPLEGPLNKATARRLLHGYLAATSYVDAQVGRVLDSLRANNLTDNTIVVLWGDHGWHLGDHGTWGKLTNYEEATRTPLIISAPGYPKNVSSKALIESVDIFPTLCDLTNLPTPARLNGKSFASVLNAPNTTVRNFITHVHPRQNLLGRAIRTERYRLVEWKVPGAASETAVYELYDYETDPDETRNLFADRPKVAAEMLRLLATYRAAKPPIRPLTDAADDEDE